MPFALEEPRSSVVRPEENAAPLQTNRPVTTRALNRQLLDTLATHIEVEGSWEHLVVSDATAAKLYELERRCRHRERLLDHLGVET